MFLYYELYLFLVGSFPIICLRNPSFLQNSDKILPPLQNCHVYEVVSDSLQPHELQQASLPCPSSLSPRACSNSCPLCQGCHPSISSSCPLLLLPSIFPSIRVFSNEWGLCIRWPKYWSFGINSSNEYSGLISFRRNCYSSKVYTIYYLSLDLLHPKHCTTLIRAL